MKQLQLQLHLSKEKLMRIKYEHDFKLLHKMCMLKSFYAKNISQKRKRERKSIQYDIRPRKKIHLKKKNKLLDCRRPIQQSSLLHINCWYLNPYMIINPFLNEKKFKIQPTILFSSKTSSSSKNNYFNSQVHLNPFWENKRKIYTIS